MLELLVVVTLFGYIYYLRNYADLRSKSEKEEAEFSPGVGEQSGNRETSSQVKAPFVDKKLIVGMVMVVFTSVLIVLVVKDAESVHLPYLVAVFCAIAIGFVEPHKGWLLALMQCVLVLSGYFLFTTQPETSGSRELENFSLYGSVVLTFVASFLGGFMKRALNMQ